VVKKISSSFHSCQRKISLAYDFTKNYTTKEFKIPTKNTRKIQSVAPEKTTFFDDAQPSEEANTTGTPTTKASDKAIKAKRVS
jgi:hypothetical protein